jgi:hypothetical protein
VDTVPFTGYETAFESTGKTGYKFPKLRPLKGALQEEDVRNSNCVRLYTMAI